MVCERYSCEAGCELLYAFFNPQIPMLHRHGVTMVAHCTWPPACVKRFFWTLISKPKEALNDKSLPEQVCWILL